MCATCRRARTARTARRSAPSSAASATERTSGRRISSRRAPPTRSCFAWDSVALAAPLPSHGCKSGTGSDRAWADACTSSIPVVWRWTGQTLATMPKAGAAGNEYECARLRLEPGDTTILSRYVRALDRAGIPGNRTVLARTSSCHTATWGPSGGRRRGSGGVPDGAVVGGRERRPGRLTGRRAGRAGWAARRATRRGSASGRRPGRRTVAASGGRRAIRSPSRVR